MPTRLNTSVRSFEWLTPDTLEIELPDTRLRLSFLEPGVVRCRSEKTGDDLVWVLKHMPEQAHFFGLGDKPCALNLRGRRLEMWGADHYKFTPESDPLYKSIPFFLCLNRGTQYGIYFDNTMRSYFDFGHEREDRLLFGADGGQIHCRGRCA